MNSLTFLSHETGVSGKEEKQTNVIRLSSVWIYAYSYLDIEYFTELSEVMEMDSPFSGAIIEGKNFNVLKKGSTITLNCKVMENEIEENVENSRRIDWMKNGELVNIKVRYFKNVKRKASRIYLFHFFKVLSRYFLR